MSTQALQGRRVATTSPTSSSYATPPVAGTTRPTGTGVIDYGSLNVPDLFILIPFASGGDNKTFTTRALGYRLFGSTWQKIELGEWACTASSKCGGALGSADQTDLEYAADTIVVSSAFAALEGTGFRTVSPADDNPGYILIDRLGCPIICIQGKKGDSTDANALYADL